MTIVAKARVGDPVALAPVLRQAVASINPELPVHFAQTLAQMVLDATVSKKLIAAIFGVFGLVAFGLAAIGLYGVMSYSISQRTREIGVRMALGATRGKVLGLFLRQGGWQLGLGLAIGLTLALLAGGLLAGALYGVSAHDPVVFGSTMILLGTVGIIATLVPALRALRVNPVEALRGE